MPKKSDDLDYGKSRARDLQASLRSEQARAMKKQAEMEALRREVRAVEAQDKPLRSKKTKSVLGLAGSFAGVATGLKTLGGTPKGTPTFKTTANTNPFNPNYNPARTLTSQVSKNRMKRKAFLKAQSLARHNEEENKVKLQQIKDREARKQRELEQSETKMSWTEPDGSKTILKFDDEGNLIGKEAEEETQEKLKARKEQQDVDEALVFAQEQRDGRLVRDKQGKALSKRAYKDSWTTDPRTQRSLLRQVGVRS